MHRLINWLILITFAVSPSFSAESAQERETKLLRQKAEQGDAVAQGHLGNKYMGGFGVPQDDALGVVWLRKGAEQGDTQSQRLLGISYSCGKGTPLDATIAVTWYRKAADQGDEMSQFFLGRCYTKGDGVAKDNVLAYMWYSLAYQRGNPYKKVRDELVKNMTTEEIEKAQGLVRDWKPIEKKK